jgi:hypothetical protein
MSDADLYSEDTARALEAHDSFTDMRTELTHLRAQNAELLEALRECERFCEFEGSPLGLSVAKIARSAIRAYEN